MQGPWPIMNRPAPVPELLGELTVPSHSALRPQARPARRETREAPVLMAQPSPRDHCPPSHAGRPWAGPRIPGDARVLDRGVEARTLL